MNLKEAFRYQNKLRGFMNKIEMILSYPTNVMQEKKIFLRRKVDKEAEDEESITPPATEYDPIAFDEPYLTDIAACVLKDKTISENSRKALFCKYYNPEL